MIRVAKESGIMKFKDIPILMYHNVGKSNSVWSVSVENFEQQINYLNQNGYKTISLDELGQGIKNNSETQEKLVVITFDDARKGVFTNAYPILNQVGLPVPQSPVVQ